MKDNELATSQEAWYTYGNTAQRPQHPKTGDRYLDTEADTYYACFMDGTWTVISLAGAGGVVVEDEGVVQGTATTLDFTGAGVTASYAAGQATINIPGGTDTAGIVHYDYVVDPNIASSPTTYTLSTGSTAIGYATITGAINAADAANADTSILICAGTYVENVVIPTTYTHKLWLIGEGYAKVNISPSSGIALSIPATSSHDAMYFKNLFLNGASGSYSVSATAANTEVHFEDCKFLRKVGGDFASSSFRRCVFQTGYAVDDALFTPDQVLFDSCYFSATSNWTAGDVDDHSFVNCHFVPGAARAFTVTTCTINDLAFVGCNHQASGWPFFTYDGGTTDYASGLVFSGCSFDAPGVSGSIQLNNCQAASAKGHIVSGCTFVHLNGSTYPYITSSDADNLSWAITGNTFGKASGGFLEDEAGTPPSIIGIFSNSVFGPNSPTDFNLTLTGGTGNAYFGTGTVSLSGGATCTTRSHDLESTSDHTTSSGVDGHVMRQTGATTFAFEADYYTVNYVIDGGGSAITTGVKGDVELPSDGVIEEWRLLADQSGSIDIQIWKDTYANFPPTVADQILNPTIVTATKNEATGLAQTVSSEDILRFNANGAATSITRCTVALRIRKT